MSGPFGASPWGYNPSTDFYSHTIDQSLRFNDDDNAYLSRTPSSASNRRTFTFSAWIKVNPAATNYPPIFSADNSTPDFVIRLSNTGSLQVVVENGGGGNSLLLTNRLFRDPSSWYHIVVAIDTTNSTADDRIKIYVNGVQETSFSSRTNPSLNFETKVNNTVLHRLGLQRYGSYWDGYMAEVNFLDGLAYDPSYFGETKDGVWIAKQYSGSYGTNGFHLTFADSSAIGDDTSGNGNDFTANNLAAIDVVPDSPTNNFATLNSVGKFFGEGGNTKTFSEGNLKVAQSGGGSHDTATIAIETGHTQGYYWEVIVSSMDTARTYIGIVADDPDSNASLIASYGFTKKYILNRDGTFWGNNNSNASGTSSYTAYAQGDIVMVAYKNGRIWFGVNGTWMNSGDPANGTGFLTAQDGTSPLDRNQAAWLPYFGYRSTFIVNFGQNGTFNGTKTAQGNADENGIGNFFYAVPSGFLALASSNLPDSTIGPKQTEQADDNFNTLLYTGDGTTSRAITGVGFAPDWIWIKCRSHTEDHALEDTVRGVGKKLDTSGTETEETTATAVLSAHGSDGFTLPASTPGNLNVNARTYVAWNWKAGGKADTFNIDGTGYSSASDAGLSGGNITPTGASINTTAGFSIISYTGNETANQTIKHGLSSAPEFSIIKCRVSNSNNNQWQLSSSQIGDDYFYFTTTAATGVAGVFPTSGDATTVTIGRTGNNVKNTNENNKDFIMYNFHSVEGYSKFGTYIGNGNADGPFVFTGFRPHFLISTCKIGGTGNWFMLDTTRSTFNEADDRLNADVNSTESTSNSDIDFLSNGFKLRTASTAGINQNTDTMFYFAFAEAPFKFANAR